MAKAGPPSSRFSDLLSAVESMFGCYFPVKRCTSMHLLALVFHIPGTCSNDLICSEAQWQSFQLM